MFITIGVISCYNILCLQKQYEAPSINSNLVSYNRMISRSHVQVGRICDVMPFNTLT